MNRSAPAGLILSGLPLIIAVAWFAPFSTIGRPSPADGGTVIVRPAPSGIITRLLVREDQRVEAGQPLVRMISIGTGERLAKARAWHDVLRIREARLIAQYDDRDDLRFPPDLAARVGEPALSRAMATEHRAFANRAAIERNLPARIAQVHRQLAAVSARLDPADEVVIRAPAAGRVAGVSRLRTGKVLDGSRAIEIVPAGRVLAAR